MAEIVRLCESNYRQVVPTLRHIADEIERGDFGEVTCIGIALLGDKCHVFGAGVDSEAPSVALLLQAGAHRLISAIASHGSQE